VEFLHELWEIAPPRQLLFTRGPGHDDQTAGTPLCCKARWMVGTYWVGQGGLKLGGVGYHVAGEKLDRAIMLRDEI